MNLLPLESYFFINSKKKKLKKKKTCWCFFSYKLELIILKKYLMTEQIYDYIHSYRPKFVQM